MKKLFIILFLALFTFSCGKSPYKKRKNCKGNGSWYGNRNLGQTTNDSTDLFTFKY